MLTIDVERSSGVAVVHCSGRLVRGVEVCTLRNAVVSEKTTRIVVLDLSQVEFMDAGGLNALVSLHHWTRNHGIQLKLTQSVAPGARDADPHPSEPGVRDFVAARRPGHPERRGLSSREVRIRIYGPGASPGGKIKRASAVGLAQPEKKGRA